jgi:hypothetical protein
MLWLRESGAEEGHLPDGHADQGSSKTVPSAPVPTELCREARQ